MLQMVKTYFAPLFKSIMNTLLIKNKVLLAISLSFAGYFEYLITLSKTTWQGVAWSLIFVAIGTIIYNTVTGVMANHHLAMIAKKEGNQNVYLEHRFQFKKLTYVLFKLITFFSWILISKQVNDALTGDDKFNFTFKMISLVPVVMFILYEFISANENIKIKYGSYPYIINPIVELFEAIKKKYKKALDE